MKKRKAKVKYLKVKIGTLISIFLFSLIFIIKTVSSLSSFSVYLTLSENSQVFSDIVTINVSISNISYPVTNCYLYFWEKNRSKIKYNMSIDGLTCSREVGFLKNNVTYFYFVEFINDDGYINETDVFNFTTNYKGSTCDTSSSLAVRNCIISFLEGIWVGNSLEGFLSFVLIVTSLIILFLSINKNKD